MIPTVFYPNTTKKAKQSFIRGAKELGKNHNTPDLDFFEVAVSYNSAYQKM